MRWSLHFFPAGWQGATGIRFERNELEIKGISSMKTIGIKRQLSHFWSYLTLQLAEVVVVANAKAVSICLTSLENLSTIHLLKLAARSNPTEVFCGELQVCILI